MIVGNHSELSSNQFPVALSLPSNDWRASMTWAGAVPGCRNAATEISRSRIMVSMRRRGWSSPVPESLPESVRHVPLHEHVCGALLHRLRSAVHTIVSDLRLSALKPSALCRETRWPSALSAGPLSCWRVAAHCAASLKTLPPPRKAEHGQAASSRWWHRPMFGP